MLDIIDMLNWATKPIHMTEEHHMLDRKTLLYLDQIHEAFSRQFADDLDELYDKITELVSAEHFERGFWMGLRLGQFAEQGPRGGVRNP